jgi:nicotinamide mononucleotide transporter
LEETIKKQDAAPHAFRRILEWAAVITNLLFTIFYLNRIEWAFAMGILGPALLFILSWREKLYAEPVLQAVYIVSAVVGWLNVQDGWSQWQIDMRTHAVLFITSVALAFVWGAALKRYTRANFPVLDAFVASWGMLATWLMMYQVHACWLYLMAVNSLSIFIYFRRRLFIAACMFVLYFIMSIDGYFQLHWFEL